MIVQAPPLGGELGGDSVEVEGCYFVDFMPELHTEFRFGEDWTILPLRGSFDLSLDGIIQFIRDESDDFVDGIVIPFRDVIEDETNSLIRWVIKTLDVLDDGQGK